MIHTSEISTFLTRHESNSLRGYVPCKHRNFHAGMDRGECGPVIGQSGVTIGAGLDLGQQRDSDLKRMGILPHLLPVLRPYLGKRKESAISQLMARPLMLSVAECEELNAAVHGDYIRRVAGLYDVATHHLPFADLPWQAQAVITSLYYQLGSSSKYPVTWGHLCHGDWGAAAHELRTGFRDYAYRRQDEAATLEQLL